ncbi:MAG: SPFH domain-containing protein [Clostridia bacterium]|nr:SPFH domain-containing protein [Clostridia bacterium]
MGLLDLFGSKSKPQVIKFDQNLCNASVNDNDVLFVRVNSIIEKKDAIVEVPMTHVALLIKGGGDCRFLDSGNYEVFDDRSEVNDWKKGLSVEVVYMPKETDIVICWGTPERFTYRDPYSFKTVKIGANGEFGINISNPTQFFKKLVGARQEFSREDFETRVLSAVVNEFCDAFCAVALEKKLTYEQFTSDKKFIASLIAKILNQKFDEDWGIELSNFIINSINLAEGNEEMLENYIESNIEEMKKRLREIERRDEAERLDDKQWEREKYLRELEMRDKSAQYEVIKSAAGSSAPTGGRFCANCGAAMEPSAQFCTNCGKRAPDAEIICEQCGTANKGSASFCQKCGNKL